MSAKQEFLREGEARLTQQASSGYWGLFDRGLRLRLSDRRSEKQEAWNRYPTGNPSVSTSVLLLVVHQSLDLSWSYGLLPLLGQGCLTDSVCCGSGRSQSDRTSSWLDGVLHATSSAIEQCV